MVSEVQYGHHYQTFVCCSYLSTDEENPHTKRQQLLADLETERVFASVSPSVIEESSVSISKIFEFSNKVFSQPSVDANSIKASSAGDSKESSVMASSYFITLLNPTDETSQALEFVSSLSNIFGTSIASLPSEMLPLSRHFADESLVVLPSVLVVPDSKYFTESTSALLSESLGRNIFNYSTVAVALDKSLLYKSTTSTPSQVFLSDNSFFDESTTFLFSSVLPSNSIFLQESIRLISEENLLYESTETFSQELSVSLDESSGLLPAASEVLESISVGLEPPKGTASLTQVDTSVLNTEELQPSTEIRYSWEYTATLMLHSHTLLEDTSSSLSPVETELFTFNNEISSTPMITHDVSIILTETEEGNILPLISATATISSMTERILLESTTTANDRSVTVPTASITSTVNDSSDALLVKSSLDDELSTGYKIVIGILIPLGITCLILFGVFFYRRLVLWLIN